MTTTISGYFENCLKVTNAESWKSVTDSLSLCSGTCSELCVYFFFCAALEISSNHSAVVKLCVSNALTAQCEVVSRLDEDRVR